jgi:DNA polymerase III subunit epsilon
MPHVLVAVGTVAGHHMGQQTPDETPGTEYAVASRPDPIPLDRRGTSRRDSAQQAELSADEWEALEGIARTLTTSGWYRVVRRFQRRDRYATPKPADVRRGLYVDVETTGLDTATDHVIEFAAVPFEFDTDGCVYDIGAPLTYFEDPGVPIPAAITRITGIDESMLKDQRIDDDRVNELVAGCALIIAHNAAFDRRILERRLPKFADAYWACSQREVPWSDFGCDGTKLEYLLYRICGEFHDGHRATDDCLVGIHLLAEPRKDGRTALSYLLESARKPTKRIWALDSPFELKDGLKARGYRWCDGSDGRPRSWYRDVPESELEAERVWLIENIYARNASRTFPVDSINAKDRYSTRV